MTEPTEPTEEELEQAWREIEAIRGEIVASPGHALVSAMMSLARSHRLLEGNERELLAFAERIEQPESLPIFDLDHPERLDDALDEADRLLHNFLAAAFSVVEHTIAFRNRHVSKGSPLAEWYTLNNPFPTNPLLHFVADLRNIAQHSRLPVTATHIRGWRQEGGRLQLHHYLVLDRAALAQHDDWDELSRQFIEEMEEPLILAPLLSAFAKVIRRFSDAFIRRFLAANVDHLKELDSLHQQLGPANALFQPPLFRPPRT